MQHPAKHYPVDEWEARDDFPIATKLCLQYVKVRYVFDERSEKLTNCDSNANVYGPHFHAISIPYQAWYWDSYITVIITINADVKSCITSNFQVWF